MDKKIQEIRDWMDAPGVPEDYDPNLDYLSDLMIYIDKLEAVLWKIANFGDLVSKRVAQHALDALEVCPKCNGYGWTGTTALPIECEDPFHEPPILKGEQEDG